jgi:hypothetical protein
MPTTSIPFYLRVGEKELDNKGSLLGAKWHSIAFTLGKFPLFFNKWITV